jgi:hypothetical protein
MLKSAIVKGFLAPTAIVSNPTVYGTEPLSYVSENDALEVATGDASVIKKTS